MAIDPAERKKPISLNYRQIQGLSVPAKRSLFKLDDRFAKMMASSDMSPTERMTVFPQSVRQNMTPEQQSILSGGQRIWDVNQYTGDMVRDRARRGGYQSGGRSPSANETTMAQSEFDRVMQKVGVRASLDERTSKGINSGVIDRILPSLKNHPQRDEILGVLAKRSKDLGISPSSIAMVWKIENPNLITNLAGGTKGGYVGLYQMGAAALKDVGLTKNQYAKMTPTQQDEIWSQWHKKYDRIPDDIKNDPNKVATFLMARQLTVSVDLNNPDANLSPGATQAKEIGGSNTTLNSIQAYMNKTNPENESGFDSASAEPLGNFEEWKRQNPDGTKEQFATAMEVEYQRTINAENAATAMATTLIASGATAEQVAEMQSTFRNDPGNFYTKAEELGIPKLVAEKARETATAMGDFAKFVNEVQGTEAGKRDLPIDNHLRNIMGQAAAITNVDSTTRVTSGGQGKMPDGKKSKGEIGTHEHYVHEGETGGGAADFNYQVTDPDTGKTRTINPYGSAEDMELVAKLTEEFAAGGGRSAGFGYMSDKTKIHFGTSRRGNFGVYKGPQYLKEAFGRGRARYLKELKDRGLDDEDAGRSLFAEKQKERDILKQQVAKAESVTSIPTTPLPPAGWDRADLGATPTTATASIPPLPEPETPPETLSDMHLKDMVAAATSPEPPKLTKGTGPEGVIVDDTTNIVVGEGEDGKGKKGAGDNKELVTVQPLNSDGTPKRDDRSSTSKDTGPLPNITVQASQPDMPPQQDAEQNRDPSKVDSRMTSAPGQPDTGWSGEVTNYTPASLTRYWEDTCGYRKEEGWSGLLPMTKSSSVA